MTRHHLVRHATAGERAAWARPDELRPLDEHGRSQAAGLVALLREAEIVTMLSSPYVRCVQTLEPLATVRGLRIEPVDVLAEGAGDRALGLLLEQDRPSTVACTHGDVVLAVMEAVAASGVELGRDAQAEKGGVWVLDVAGGRVERVAYLPPRTAEPRR